MSKSQTSPSNPSPPASRSNSNQQSNALASIGGGMLALGIILILIPGFIHSATSTDSQIWGILKLAGQIILGCSALMLITALVRSIAHTSRRSAVR